MREIGVQTYCAGMKEMLFEFLYAIFFK